MSHGEKEPYVCNPTDQDAGRPATFIFLHGYGDDAEGIPLGLAQQFQFNSKLPYLRWVLPNAPRNIEAMETAWYQPKALPNTMKPRVPGQDNDEDNDGESDISQADDEDGIMKSVDYVDSLVAREINERGVDPKRIVVGGFSQGCAVTLVWGLAGGYREQVAGVVGLSGYLPLARRIEAVRRDKEEEKAEAGTGAGTGARNRKKWFYVHGTRDVLVPMRYFTHGKAELLKFIDEKDVEEHTYEGMGHSTAPAELRDLLGYLNKVVPA